MNNYLHDLIQLARKELETYKLNSQDFGKINALFIKKLLDENSFNYLFIQLTETKKLYLPVVSVSFLFLYEKNYQINIETEFEIGDIICDKRDKHSYQIEENNTTIPHSSENGYKLIYKYIEKRVNKYTDKKCNQGTRYIPNSQFKINNYIKIIDHTHKKYDFSKLLDFLKHLSIEEILADFNYKIAIICHKQEFINDLRHTDWHKAIPYRYLTKDGKAEDNLPINPLIYIASDYQAIREHIFDKGEQLELVIFFDKYNDADTISKDIRQGKLKKCLFIGEDECQIKHDNLLTWRWTPEECRYFYPQDFPMAEILPIYVQNRELLKAIQKFIEDIEEIEQQYIIQLSALKYYAKRALLTVVPEIDNISIKEFLFDDLYSAGLDTEEIDEYAELFEDSYQDIFKQIQYSNNSKAITIETLNKSNVFKTNFDYLIVSKQHKDSWQQLLPDKKILTYREWQKNKGKQKKVLFLGLYGYTHYKTMQNSHDSISILIYADSEEQNAFEYYQEKYKLELDNEYHSEDREKLSGINYPIPRIKKEQTINESVFFEDIKREDIIAKLRNNEREEVFKKFIFKDNPEEILAISRYVLIKENDNLTRIRLSNVREGDEIGIYDNINKDKLDSVATEQQKQVINKCKEYAKQWKEALFQLYRSNYFNAEEKLLADLKNKGADITHINTLNRWLDRNDKMLFPTKTKNLTAIIELVNDNSLNEKSKEIHKARRLYRSITIALGQDFSHAITTYITSNQKTELLKRFSDADIQKILKENIPIKKVVKIIEPDESFEPITLIEANSNKDSDKLTQEEETMTNEELDTLKQESEDLEQQAESLNNNVDILELDISGISEKLEAVIKENQELREKVQKLTDKLQEAEGKIDSLATTQKHHHNAIKKLIDAFKSLKGSLK